MSQGIFARLLTRATLLLITLVGFGFFAAVPARADFYLNNCYIVEDATLAAPLPNPIPPLLSGDYQGGGYVLKLIEGETIVMTMDVIHSWQVLLVNGNGVLIDSGVQNGAGSFTLVVPVSGIQTLWLIWLVADVDINTFVPLSCFEPGTVPIVAGVGQPVPETWEGSPESILGNYDGRIEASQADRYAVYCKDRELQVWDGVNGVRVGALAFEAIAALENPVSVAIGENVYLGRSNNVLGVVIPGEYENLTLEMDTCLNGGYDTGS